MNPASQGVADQIRCVKISDLAEFFFVRAASPINEGPSGAQLRNGILSEMYLFSARSLLLKELPIFWQILSGNGKRSSVRLRQQES